VGSLRDLEASSKLRWVARLEAIAERSGAAVRLGDLAPDPGDGPLSESERIALKRMVLSMGAARTMAAHVRSWERFEAWAATVQLSVLPPCLDTVLKYLLLLHTTECGPTVVPAFRATVTWIGTRLSMQVPDMANPQVLALEKQIIEERAKETREAIPIPVELLGFLEHYLFDVSGPMRSFVWWLLCMIFASLRFNDACHVSTDSLSMQDDGLFGTIWQTKVERRRRGTRFAVARAGVSGRDWLQCGWDEFQHQLGGAHRDYWMAELGDPETFHRAPVSYDRGLKFFRFALQQAVSLAYKDNRCSEEARKSLTKVIRSVTWHSARVTLLSAAVHKGRSSEEIALQANWKNPGALVLKYTRDRRTIPIQMVQGLVRDMRQGWRPGGQASRSEDASDSDVEDPSVEPSPLMFYVKRATVSNRSICEFKYHIMSAVDPRALACNTQGLTIDQCVPVGPALPDRSLLCRRCLLTRPDLAE
jgi:hypothetical protein